MPYYRPPSAADSLNPQFAMKIKCNSLKSWLFGTVLLALPSAAQAQLDYTNNGDGTCAITGYTGSGGAVTIPGTINGLTVTGIGDSAFFLIGLTSITIPASVTNIGAYAFEDDSLMTSVYFEGNAPTSGLYAFETHSGGNTTAYYLPGTSGWGDEYDYIIPAVMLNPPNPAGLLQVTISPAGAVTAGAYWQVDGGIPQPNGATVLGLTVGNHTVSFRTVNGWATPSTQIISVSANSTSTTTGIYGGGSLQVAITPASAITAGAQWQVDGGTLQNSGTTVSNLSVGNHTISFSTISGWTTPANQTISLSADSAINAIGTYVQQIPFNYTDDDGAVTITGYTGSGGAVIIPGTILVNGVSLPVVNIGDEAFAGNGALTSVTIPNSVTNIGSGAFSDCDSLTSVTIGTNVSSIGDFAFEWTLLTGITIPNSVTSIGDYAFYACTLTSLTIPNSVSTIGEDAFMQSSLTSVAIGSGVTSIGEDAFAWCFSLTGITVNTGNPAYLSMNGVLFNKNQTTLIQYPLGLGGSYTVPTGVTSIGTGAFWQCHLTSVTVPDSVTNIGDYAFALYYGLISITFQGNAPGADSTVFSTNNAAVYYFSGTSGWASTFEGVPAVMLNAPNPNGSLQVSIAPAGAVTAGAQWHVDGGITQPEGATVLGLTVGDHTVSFSTISGWTTPPNQIISISANSTATAIGTYVSQAPLPFNYTTNNGTITIIGYTGSGGGVTIPGTINGLTVTGIGFEAFYDHSSIINVLIPDSVTNIGAFAFFGTSLTNVSISSSVASIGQEAFTWCFNLTAITVDTQNAFYSSVNGVLFDKPSATLLECPDGLKGSYMILNGVTGIGPDAFQGCGLTGITIPNSVSNIGEGAFNQCFNLANARIPESVTNIGYAAFFLCTSLTAIMVDSQNSFYSSVNGALFDKKQTTLVEYPGGSGKSYAIPDGVTSIGENAFSGCTSLISVTIPRSVTDIADDAFYYSTSLASVYFQGNAPTADSTVFEDDNNATAYYLPGTSGWSSMFAGIPTALWFLSNPLILNSSPNLGVQNKQFGFTISWATNIPVVIEACTNLANPAWIPVSTNTLTGGTSDFSDPQWANYPRRFYRISTP